MSKALKPIINKTFYFIRHAQTNANAQELMCGGDWDIPLNQAGIEQVKVAKEVFEKINGKIKHIFVSPMKRTILTAELLNKKSSLPIEPVEGLREWRVGEWERRPWSDVPNALTTKENPPNGETQEEFKERIVSTINKCLDMKVDDDVLFVSHGAVAHTLFSYMGIEGPFIKNATIYKLTPRESMWHLEEAL